MHDQDRPEDETARVWLVPFALLASLAFTLLVIVGIVDFSDPLGAFRQLWSPEPDAALGALASTGEILAGVLAVAITVVAIVVELAATRYTHRITQLFVRDPRNYTVTGFFVVTAVVAICVSVLPAPGAFPLQAARLSIGMLLLSLFLLMPYFAFVFTFVSPMNIVTRMRRRAMGRVASRRRGLSQAQRKAAAIEGIDDIADMGQNAVESRDKGVAVACVDALGALATDYQELRGGFDDAWFTVDGPVLRDLDFVSLSPVVLDDISRQRTWLEMKVLRRYNALFAQALGRDPDLAHLVAIRTRALAEATREPAVIAVAVKFFNTYLRGALNAQDRRSAYNVLQQYRLMAEHSLAYDKGRLAIRIGDHLAYYARQALRGNMPVVVQTIAYDYGALVEVAFDAKSPATPKLLKGFLGLDEDVQANGGEDSLLGVRKAQVRLATFFMLRGATKAARRIWADMKDEPAGRLQVIRRDLMRAHEPDFWEINDRGVNFEYLSEERKEKAWEFFGWFGAVTEKSSTSTQFFEMTLGRVGAARAGEDGEDGDDGSETEEVDADEALAGRFEPDELD